MVIVIITSRKSEGTYSLAAANEESTNGINWNHKILVSHEVGKPEWRNKNLSEQSREAAILTHIWHWAWNRTQYM